MCEDNSKALVEDFLKSSMSPVKVLMKKLATSNKNHGAKTGNTIPLRERSKRSSVQFTGTKFFSEGLS